MLDRLTEQLRALNDRLTDDGIRIAVAGGFGLVLRETYLRREGREPRRALPLATRSTDDLDIVLRASIVANADQMRRISEVLGELGYEVIPRAQYYQFVEKEPTAGVERRIKIDLLSEPIPPELEHLVEIDPRRVRAKGFKKLHAHTTEEALTVFDHATEIPLGDRTILVPHPFSHTLLKLFALRDRMWERGPEGVDAPLRKGDFGAYHAFDIYRMLAMMSRDEWREAQELSARYQRTHVMRVACRYVSLLFAGEPAQGIQRIAEFAGAKDVVPPEDIRETAEDLLALFPPSNAAEPTEARSPGSSGLETAASLDDARRLLVESLAAEAAALRERLDADGRAAVDELEAMAAERIMTGGDLPAKLLQKETWKGGFGWAVGGDDERRAHLRRLIEIVYRQS